MKFFAIAERWPEIIYSSAIRRK